MTFPEYWAAKGHLCSDPEDVARLAWDAAREWHTIDSAPKDGKILLFCPGLKSGPVIWIGSGAIRYGNSAGIGTPTHWQPLPSPPTPTGGAA